MCVDNLRNPQLEILQNESTTMEYGYKRLCNECEKYTGSNHDYSKCRKEKCLKLSILDLFFNIEQEKHEVLGTNDKI
jgi:hypothetical protein